MSFWACKYHCLLSSRRACSVAESCLVTPWTVAHQAPLSMGSSRQEYWRGLPFPFLGELPDPGIEPMSLTPPATAGRFFTTEPPRKSQSCQCFRWMGPFKEWHTHTAWVSSAQGYVPFSYRTSLENTHLKMKLSGISKGSYQSIR